jgi:GntR family transcriptional regulator
VPVESQVGFTPGRIENTQSILALLNCINTIGTVRSQTLEFTISTTAGVPIYQQLIEQVCSAIARGRLRADQRLPSVRELSQALVVNPNTVARAYTELEREGTLYTRPGLGVFVSASRQALPKTVRRQRLTHSVDQLLVAAVRLGCERKEVLELVDERMEQFQWPSSAAPAS